MASACPGFLPFKLSETGNFSDKAYYSHEMFEAFTPIILEALGNVSRSLDQPFVIADYGTADGGASYNIIRQCIAQLRIRYGPDLPIHVIYEDQPVNDFQPVFARADGLLPGSDGLNSEFGNVFVTACGTSFYRQCLPDNSLDFILSSTTLHWLSRCPVEMPQDLFPNLASPRLREQFKEQARLDLEGFIRHRERELKSGSRMILINVDCSPETSYLPEITDVWRSLVADGTITQAEFSSTNFAMYCRLAEEWMEPFERQDLGSNKSGLSLVLSQSSEVHWGGDNISEAGEKDSLEKFGRSVVRSIRSWTDQNLYNGLSEDRSHAQKMDILNTYYKTLFLRLIAKEENLKRISPVSCLVVEKSMIKNATTLRLQASL